MSGLFIDLFFFQICFLLKSAPKLISFIKCTTIKYTKRNFMMSANPERASSSECNICNQSGILVY